MTQKEIREQRKAEGTCTRCGFRAAREGRTTCWECSRVLTKAQMKRYYARKEARLCVQCGDPLKEDEKAICKTCIKMKKLKDQQKLIDYRANREAEVIV